MGIRARPRLTYRRSASCVSAVRASRIAGTRTAHEPALPHRLRRPRHRHASQAGARRAAASASAWTPTCGSGSFLAHAKLYLEGSKAPDNEFKDFKNHVLHTRDGYWGGAPEKVRSWYQHLVEALAQQDWPTAVYCAGVLSHYYTDPLQPFHTAQSEAENNIHRAVEWSISQGLRRAVRAGRARVRRHERRSAARAPTGWPSSSARARRGPTATTRS